MTDLGRLKNKAIDPFSLHVIESGERALADTDNVLRINFFSTAMRILFEHIMDTLSPISEVVHSCWYAPEKADAPPTRRQRITFAIQGGFSDAFLTETLHVDPIALHKRLLAVVDELSKHVHGRAHTVLTDRADQDAMVKTTIAAMDDFLDAIRECREAVLQPIAEAIDSAAVDALISETIGDVDELATHHSVEDISVEKVSVHALRAKEVVYRASGWVDVILQWGSNSDLRRGDGAELAQSFPFYCDIEVSIDDPWNISSGETNYGVDTSDWYGEPLPVKNHPEQW